MKTPLQQAHPVKLEAGGPAELIFHSIIKENHRGTRSVAIGDDCREVFITASAPGGLAFSKAIAVLWQEYVNSLKDAGVDQDTAIYLRFYLSDIANDAETLTAFLQQQQKQTKYFLIGQPPANDSKVAMEAYHLIAALPPEKTFLADGTLLVRHKHYQSYWWNSPPTASGPTHLQTNALFQALDTSIREMGSTMPKSLLRTWIYVRDIDNNYAQMAASRKKIFTDIGLTQHSHYVASTGIEGLDRSPGQFVRMDAMGMLGLSNRQITYLSAPEMMCPTSHYGITFERGTKVTFGDRCHFYISGTASIDRFGQVLHRGDVVRQIERTMENIEALLAPHDAGLKNLGLMTIYLRDTADLDRIKPVLESIFHGNVPPCTFLRGAVCRPSWLVEVEGFACTDKGIDVFPPLA